MLFGFRKNHDRECNALKITVGHFIIENSLNNPKI
jgi:hypothetical protein